MKELTIEEKQLLLQDLCTRLPYGIKCKDQYGDYININIYNVHIEHLIDQMVSGVVQMILRLMSSMTEEERKSFPYPYYFEVFDADVSMLFTDDKVVASISVFEIVEIVNWLNKHHFDYRGLIEKGLALEALEGMYKIK